MKDNIIDFRVAFRKKGDTKDTVICIGVDNADRLESIVMDMARVKSLLELDSFESHRINKDGTTEIREHIAPKTTAVTQVVPPVKKMPEIKGILTMFYKTATAEGIKHAKLGTVAG